MTLASTGTVELTQNAAACVLGLSDGRILMHVGGASDGSRLVVEYQKRYKMHT
jgi:hypothetical protein